MAPVEVAQNLTVTSRKVMNPTVMSLWEVPVEMEKIMEPWHHLGVTRGEIHSENTASMNNNAILSEVVVLCLT